MKRYFLLFISLVNNNLTQFMEYRGNFFLSTSIAILWVLLQVWVINIYFNYTDNILGWTKVEVYLLIGLFRFSKGLFDMFLRKNLFELPDQIDQGTLDYNLTKPVNSLFLVSLRYHIISEVSTLILGGVILVYALGAINFQINLFSIAEVVCMLTVGLVAYYSIFTIFVTFAFFTTRLTAASSFQEVVSQIMRYPTDVFSRNNIFAGILLFPLLITYTLPAKILLGKVPFYYFFVELAVVSLLFIITYRFWNFALKHYSSASS